MLGFCHGLSLYVFLHLLDIIAGVMFTDDTGNTALHYVIWRNAEYSTRLHKAVRGNNVADVCTMIYEYKDNVNALDNGGWTPLYRAVYWGFDDIVNVLVSLGADDSITNDEGDSALLLATRKGNKDLSSILQRQNSQAVSTVMAQFRQIVRILLITHLIKLKQSSPIDVTIA